MMRPARRFLGLCAVVMTTRASAGRVPRRCATNRRTLAYRAVKPWSSTRSCQMATAFRPRSSPSTMTSRNGSHALAAGARPGLLLPFYLFLLCLFFIYIYPIAIWTRKLERKYVVRS